MEKENSCKEIRVNINFLLLHLFKAFNYRVHQKMKQKKFLEGCDNKMSEQHQHSDKLKLISKDQQIFNSFIRQTSSKACNKMLKDPEQAVLCLLHIYDQFSKSP